MSDTEIMVQVVPTAGAAGEIGGPRVPEKFAARVKELGASIADVANELRQELERNIATQPDTEWTLDEVALAFSLDLEAEAGVVITKAKTTAGFEATLTWKRKTREVS